MKNRKEEKLTDFGYEQIPLSEKVHRVKSVFSSVAEKYDLMNDMMSLGIHRLWKRFALSLAEIRPKQKILDVAAGTGDISLLISKALNHSGQLVVSDINESMLEIGRSKLIDNGFIHNIEFVQADAENLPFEENCFDTVFIAFGLRNVSQKENALKSFFRVLKPGGRLIILEFSKPLIPLVSKIYDQYSFKILPWLGKIIAQDEASYRYLAESIRKHPDQQLLKSMMESEGFEGCEVFNLSSGIVAVHRGYKY